MDPLSEVLALFKPRSYVAGGVAIDGGMAIRWPQHAGIKCYAVVSGQCWLSVAGVAETVLLTAGDCYLLPPGAPFRLATDLSATPVDFQTLRAKWKAASGSESVSEHDGGCYLVGGHFVLTGSHADFLLSALAPIVHIRKESDKAAMRWSLERMQEEVRHPQPGASLITQQLAYMMLVQALRLHLADGAQEGVGWLFALADKQMGAAIRGMHDDPGRKWTLQTLAQHVGMSRSVFALRFKQTVGTTPMEYLTRWRMLLAGERLKNSCESTSAIALSLGYESESAFGKAFKKVMRCTPREHGRNAGTQSVAFAATDASGNDHAMGAAVSLS
ncbi:AraC family transcriptional regulator [Herbaspirillum autotrophicum]|uniref:AraC family transcriptional regulator n=1 Tax=Herbaspirillum autotrophicum TaxID=180195 RepID=UPI00067AE59F|nr:AraC family transcriptional regulator [Herbaspirillum autotrophicum]